MGDTQPDMRAESKPGGGDVLSPTLLPPLDRPWRATDGMRLLVIEDDRKFVEDLRRSLATLPTSPISVRSAGTLAQGIEAVQSGWPNVVLLDLSLPDSEREQTFKRLSPHAMHLPVVVISGHDDEELAVNTLKQGAQDYLVKGESSTPLLIRVIRYAIERKRLDLALRQREEFFRLITENAHDLISVLDAGGRRLYSSPSYAGILGQPDQLVGTDSLSDVHPEDAPRLRHMFSETVKSGVGQRAEYRLIAKDGSVRYIESQGSVIRDSAGNCANVVVVSRDITDRKRVEEELRESERRYKMLLKSVTDYIYTVKLNPDGSRQTEHGPGCISVTGYSPADYRNDPELWHRMIPPEDRPVVENMIQRAEAGVSAPPLQHRIVHKDGSIRWVRNNTVPHRNTQGVVESYDGLVSDVTEAKLAEDNLRKTEERLQAIMDQTPAVIYLKDPDGRYLYVNSQFEQLFHVQREGVIGRTDLDIFPAATADRLQQNDRLILEALKPKSFDERVPQDDGVHHYLSVKFPLFDLNRAPYAVCGISTDITERQRAEEELQSRNRDLKRALTELTETRSQLHQAERLKAIGTLAAGVAHEVKNPLQILILGLGDLAPQLRKADVEIQHTLSDMYDAIERADTIVRSLLDFSRLTRLDLKPAAVKEVLESALRLEHFNLVKARVRVSKRCDSNLPAVSLDRQKMQQVFVNLISNAIDAMPDGGELTISAVQRRCSEADWASGIGDTSLWRVGDSCVVITFQDTGAGINPELLPRIFEPFFTTKAHSQGTGLGLPVAENIVSLHGGTIQVENPPGGGVKVTIRLRTNLNEHENNPHSGRGR